MAVSIDWATKVITIPKADTTLVDAGPPEIRSYDVDAFRLELNDIQDSEEGIVFDTTHEHTPEKTLSGITYARFVEIINGYTVEFENGSYTVQLTGANHNIADVQVQNSVGIVVQNSAGLIVLEGSGLTAAQSAALTQIQKLLEADQFYDQSEGLLHYYDRGTTTDLIPAKTIAGTSQDQDASATQ